MYHIHVALEVLRNKKVDETSFITNVSSSSLCHCHELGLSFFLSLDTALPPREDYVQVATTCYEL